MHSIINAISKAYSQVRESEFDSSRISYINAANSANRQISNFISKFEFERGENIAYLKKSENTIINSKFAIQNLYSPTIYLKMNSKKDAIIIILSFSKDIPESISFSNKKSVSSIFTSMFPFLKFTGSTHENCYNIDFMFIMNAKCAVEQANRAFGNTPEQLELFTY